MRLCCSHCSVSVSFLKKNWMDEKGKLLSVVFVSLFDSLLLYAQITDFPNFWCIFNSGILLVISGVKEWIETCLPRNPDNKQFLHLWDSFGAHLTVSVQSDLWRCKINVAVIRGGLTPASQPLDKCLNKPFKDNIRRQYLCWVMTGPSEFTPVGKKKALWRNLVFPWIKHSWTEIPAEMMRKAFKTCSILNTLDSTKDDEVFADNMPELANNDLALEDDFEPSSEE